jgi:hypothetical protein
MREGDQIFLIVLPFALPVAFTLACALVWGAEAAVNRALRKRRRM